MLQKLEYRVKQSGFNINIEELNKHFDRICIFDSNREINNDKYIRSSKIIAIGSTQEITINTDNSLEQLQHFIDSQKGWLFGYLTYDLKNEIEHLTSNNSDGLKFSLFHFFAPKIVIQNTNDSTVIFYDDDFVSHNEAEEIYKLAITPPLSSSKEKKNIKPDIQSKISKQEYIDAVTKLKQHIRKGDIYEINFCQEFFAPNTSIDPVQVYQQLNSISQAPFAAYSRFGAHYLLCNSPERYLQKRSNILISQPIKGTIRRSKNESEDEQLKQELQKNTKEKSENVMIVDLVRNDLSRIAKTGTVNVDELFGIYSFKQVHQMISTISCELKNETSFTDIIKNTFPMGSMTGAPKVSAMKLIEQYEKTKRGLYSGAVGYINPDGDFDFNVIIRSILYNEESSYISFMVGSAITDKANAEQEYEECLLKAKAMFEALEINSDVRI